MNETINNLKKPFYHFSVDDVFNALIEISDRKIDVFEHPFFAFLKELHDEFDTNIDLYVFFQRKINGKLRTLRDVSGSIKQELINNMFPCIQDILLNSYVFWRSRFHLLKNLLSLGYSDSEIDMIMKTFLSGKKHPIKLHDNYEHYLKENQFQYVKRNKSLFSCNKVKQDGLCNLDCNCKKIIERPLYL